MTRCKNACKQELDGFKTVILLWRGWKTENTKLQQAPASRYCFEMVDGVLGLPQLGIQVLSNARTCLNTPVMTVQLHFGGLVIATCSGKHTHSEGQCREWSAVDYTGGPKAESPLSQGLWPVFLKTLYILSVHAQTHLLKFPETSLNQGKQRYKVNPWFISLEPR